MRKSKCIAMPTLMKMVGNDDLCFSHVLIVSCSQRNRTMSVTKAIFRSSRYCWSFFPLTHLICLLSLIFFMILTTSGPHMVCVVYPNHIPILDRARITGEDQFGFR